MRTPVVGWALGVVLLLSYNSWLLWPLGGNPDALQGYLSELAARDQPFSWLFRGLDAVAGLAMILIGLLGWRGWRGLLGRWAQLVAPALILAGAATILDAIFAMPCASTFDAACAAREATDPGQWAHVIASTTVGVGHGVGLGAAAVGLIRHRGWLPWGAGALVGWLIIVTLMVTTVWWAESAGRGHGSFQSAQILLTSVAVAMLGFAAVGRSRDA